MPFDADDLIVPLNLQVKALAEKGLTCEQIAECLRLDVDAVAMSLESMSVRGLDSDELVDKHRTACMEAVIDIGLDRHGQGYGPAIRLKALSMVIDRKGKLTNLPVDKLSETYKRMKEVCATYQTKITTIEGGLLDNTDSREAI